MRTHSRLTALLILAAMFVCGGVLAATVWKWVDKNGVTHYSDQPVPGAIQVDLSVQTYDSREATIPPTDRPITTPSSTAASTYSSIAITSPTNEQTFTGTGGQISVVVQVYPGVQKGDSIRLELDGLNVAEPDSTNTTFQLKDVARGAHSVSAIIVGGSGQVLKQSAAITFYVQQTSIQHNIKNKKK